MGTGDNLLVNSKEELVNKGDIVKDSCFCSKVLEISDILLEFIIGGFIRSFGGFLD